MSSRRGNRGGRIHPHERETNNNAATLGAELPTPPGLAERYNETIALSMTPACRKDYRQRIARIIKFWKENCPEYYNIGVRKVEEPELSDVTKFYFGRFKEDIRYEGLNDQFLLHFLVSTKKKADNKTLKSVEDMRKYKDAIMWAAGISELLLPAKVYAMYDKFMAGYKREYTVAKKKGNVDEMSADPIPVGLFRLLLNWALDCNNIFIWVWSLAQWNFMARCASIDPLCFRNFKLGTDSIVGMYDDAKADKAAERLSEKNIYANPHDWRLCFWTALGIWLALRVEQMTGNDRFFLDEGVKEGGAAKKYCEQLLGMIQPHIETVKNHMRLDNFNPYGLRNGSATHAVSGTTVPPPIPSIARRGEWSIGSVLDLNWHFGSIGDQYLGRILAGFDPTMASFDCLPPHWNMQDPFANEFVKKGMVSTYGTMLTEHPESVPLLLRLFACVIYHSDSLIAQVARCPGHDFTKLTVLHGRELLSKLKGLVTLEPTPGGIEQRTGIPPHVSHQRQLDTITEKLGLLIVTVNDQGTNLVTAVEGALENRAFEAGHVTGARLKTILNEYQDKNMKALKDELGNMRETLKRVAGWREDEGDDNDEDAGNWNLFDDDSGDGGQVVRSITDNFAYNGRFYFVPQDFEFPRANLKEGLRLWLLGHTTNKRGDSVVRPFRKLSTYSLPTLKHQNTYKIQWSPIFRYLEKNVGTILPADTSKMTVDEVDEYYKECVALLKEQVSYCFAKKGTKPLGWTLSTWSNRIQRSSIEKLGTARDKSFLSEATTRNRPRGAKRQRRRKMVARPRYPNRQTKRASRGCNQQDTSRQFAAAFDQLGPATAHMNNTAREAEAQAAKDDEAADWAAHLERSLVGDAVGRGGVKLFLRQPPAGGIPLNLGQNSNFERQQYSRTAEEHLGRGNRTAGERTGGNEEPAPTECSLGARCKNRHLPGYRNCHRPGCTSKIHHLCAISSNFLDPENELYSYCSSKCMP